MIVLLSPAKSLNLDPTTNKEFTMPDFQDEQQDILKVLQKKSSKSIQKLMHVSAAIGDLNYARYQAFEPEFNLENSKQAIFAFDGDVYKGMEAEKFNKKDLAFAQGHVRILSGFYGLLKPLDLMQPYRLEMGTKLTVKRKKNLYQFWDNKLTDKLNEELAENKFDTVINLASKEYFKAVKPKLLTAEIIHINFKEYHNGTLKFISFNAKKARGFMTQYIVKKKIKNSKNLKGFNMEGYGFSAEHSTDNEWMFIR